MPSLSRTQQRLMGQAYGVRKFMDTKGKEGIDPDTIDPKYRETIVDLADNMKKKALKDYASTKHKKLPEEVEKGKIPTIFSKLNPESNNRVSKEKRVMQNLSDYRDFIKKYKK